jgi:8-oxo-dGTP diphosphatase
LTEAPGARFVVNVEVAVVRDGRYLMVVRSAREALGAGSLAFPGGRLEDGALEDALEHEARREVLEETGVTAGETAYVESHTFTVAGERVFDAVLLARYAGGEAAALDPEEVQSVHWLAFDEALAHPGVEPWTVSSLVRAERLRLALGW